MKVLKWILLVLAAAGTAAGVVYAVLHRADECRCCVTNLIEKGKDVVLPCYERVIAFFTEDDFAEEVVEELAE